jgi:RNA-splicing ligase RtcB
MRHSSPTTSVRTTNRTFVFKDVDEVVEVCRLAGLAAPVARLRPIVVVKG